MPAGSEVLLWSLGITVAAVLLTAWLGRARRRRQHVAAAIVSASLLAHAVYQAERLGRALEVPRPVLVVHLVFANAATLALLVVVGTGAGLFRAERGGRRRWHRFAVVAFLALVAAALVTGSLMLLEARPKAPVVPHG